MKIEDSVETVNTSAKIDIFKYEWEFLSNFYPCEIVWEGITYASKMCIRDRDLPLVSMKMKMKNH